MRMRRHLIPAAALLTCVAAAGLAGAAPAATYPATAPSATVPADGGVPFWVWPLALLGVSFLLGVLGPLAGVGGGVLFVPIVSGFFPFHIDFVRATGLLVALSGAVAAGPGLLRGGLARLRIALPVALVTSSSAIVGAMVGLALPANVVKILLGAAILGIAGVMKLARGSELPDVPCCDKLARRLYLQGTYHEPTSGEEVPWRVHHTPVALLLFVAVGFLAGMFGLGAGWANVPVLNLVMGVPVKMAVASSHFLLAVTDSSAAWIYLNRGAVIPAIAVPSVIGIMLGSMVGARLLRRIKPRGVRVIALTVLVLAGLRTLLGGLGVL